MRLLCVGVAAAVLVMSGCPKEGSCGEGTVEQDGTCVPAQAIPRSCGEGTVPGDGGCVRAGPPPLSCRAGTELVDGRCVALDGGASAGPTCGPGTTRVGNECVVVAGDGGSSGGADAAGCMPDCLGRECGDDGCGGTCGSCDDSTRPTCNTLTGQCVAVCVPQCSGRDCGDDGCGGTCGSCASGSSCSETLLRCIPDGWTCRATYFGGGDVCDCDCGARDPDCDLGRPLAGCEDGEICNSQGACVPAAPAGWTCDPLAYDANDACDCNCGAYDPDCDFTNLFGINGCGEGVTTCNSDGTCGMCTPDCSNRECGNDGCGGTCGMCDPTNDEVCHVGTCVGRCSPTPAACLDAVCGDDGCGGVCGTCAAGTTCSGGACRTDPVEQTPFSCVGRCGSRAPSGCYCDDNCAANNNCCTDFATTCQCVPDCTGKMCGSDGCGGSCGTCSGTTPYCTDDNQCTDQCTRRCDGRQCGSDGCGGTCGTCAADETCYWTYQCIPSTWTCDGVLFGDQQGCDCGCGAVDPDCSVMDAYVYGCPLESRVCGSAGLCSITTCHSNRECGSEWCTGAYAEGNQRFGGYCANPIASGRAPGTSCTIDEHCASLLCAGGQCRTHCRTDSDCAGSTKCVALPVRDEGTRLIQGYVGACDLVAGSGDPCMSQAACGELERCIVVMDPQTTQPRYLCASLLELNAVGRSCSVNACPAGYRCEEGSSGPICTLPCPGGSGDCPSGYQCVNRPLSPLLQSGAMVPLCLPGGP